MQGFVLQDWLIMLATTAVVVVSMLILRWWLLGKQTQLSTEKRLPRQFLLLGLCIVSVIIIVLVLPINESSRNQLLALFGVLLSGVIAFSSTTIVSNLMAGVVLRFNKPFRTGDYVKSQNFAGRVTQLGLLDTEIQTEERTLVHIANSLVVNHPVEVVRSSGTIISADVSLGYDVSHQVVEKHLLQAAKSIGLSDSFVHITELGNFSINYKLRGLLEDTKSMLTSKSRLHAAILDELHRHNIEIMSPSIMAQRPVPSEHVFIAKSTKKPTKNKANEPSLHEQVAFDKAERAENLEAQIAQLQEDIENLKDAHKLSEQQEDNDQETDALAKRIEINKARLENLQSLRNNPTDT